MKFDERRFFIVKCSEDKIGDAEYFEQLRNAIADDAVRRTHITGGRARETH